MATVHNKDPNPAPQKRPQVWLVSACLLGQSCRYDGASAKSSAKAGLLPILNDENTLVPVCPEELGGLGTPREPAHFIGGSGHDLLAGKAKVCTHSGKDVSAEFLKGAQRALDIARQHGATHACLKARSPSCGSQRTHTDAGVVEGQGVAAATLQNAGLQICSEETLSDALLRGFSKDKNQSIEESS